jgi:tetratricopeptide (TPR) repeat protein/O-antigen ligase
VSWLTPLFAALHFICPLLFFTDLTRNPYVSQIAILNLGILAALVIWGMRSARRGEVETARTPFDLPFLVFIAIALLSFTVSFWRHAEFYRASMLAEGSRNILFLLINCAATYFLAASYAENRGLDHRPSIVKWTLLGLGWGALWLFFPQARATPGPLTSVWHHVWDPFGALVWIGGIVMIVMLVRRRGVHALWHVALLVGLLSSVYAVMQYFSFEFLWPKVLNPYGGRSVSTFGNPNFMSSYQVMLLPVAVVYYLESRSRVERGFYGVTALLLQTGLFCSLTRSSWAGAFAALAPLLFSARLRAKAKQDVEFHGLIATVALLGILFWPQSNVAGYASSLLGRLSEVVLIFEPDAALPYSPFYQRVLIWLCAWTMGAEAPILGQGYGLFELFYPFYQGHFLDQIDLFRIMRTHANNSHNEILEIWSQTGILGLGAALWMWIVFLRASANTAFAPVKEAVDKKGRPIENAEPSDRMWVLAGGASVLGMLVDNLLNVSMHFAVPGFLFWWTAGTTMGLIARGSGARRVWRLPVWSRPALAALLVVSAGWSARYFVNYWNREVHYFMGFKLVRGGNLRAAIVQLKKAYAWHPREVNNNYELANAYARTEQHDKALWAYDESLKANAGYDEIYFNKATVLLRKGRTAEAETNFRISWAVNPHSKQLYVAFSRYFLTGDRNHLEKHRMEAIELLERATHFWPTDVNFLNNLGYLYNLSKQYDQAEEVYVKLLQLNPEMVVAEKNLRTSLAQSKNKAPEILHRLDEYRRLGRLIAQRQLGGKTPALARQVGAWFPASLQAQFYLGNVELVSGNHAEAERILRELMAKQPKNVHLRLNLAQAVARQGRRAEALGLYRSVLTIDPQNAVARQALAAAAGQR